MVANWSETAIKLPKRMTITYFIAVPDVLRPVPVQGAFVTMTQLYKMAETKEPNMERRYAAAKQEANDEEKN